MCRDGYLRVLEQRRHQKQRSLHKINTLQSNKFTSTTNIRTVDSDTHKIANFLNFATSQTKGAEIPENQVVVATAGLQSVTVRNEGFGESTSVGDDLLGVELPFGLSNLEESSGDGSNSLYGFLFSARAGEIKRR